MIETRVEKGIVRQRVEGDPIDVYFEAVGAVEAAVKHIRKHANNSGVVILAMQEVLKPGSFVWGEKKEEE